MTLFVLVWISYTLIAFNTRVVAAARYGPTVASDALIAVVGFYLVKEIAPASHWQLVGYAAGAMAGGATGIWISKQLGHE